MTRKYLDLNAARGYSKAMAEKRDERNEGLPELSKDHSRHVTDERFNTGSHMVGSILSLTGTVFLLVNSTSVWEYVSFGLYGLGLLSLFMASTLHHGINGSPRVNAVMRLLDYNSIYLLIAGTFTPYCLILFRGRLGWSIFGIVWFLAAAGIALKSAIPRFPKWISMLIYISMGWLGALLFVPLLKTAPLMAVLLISGGVVYSIGAVIFTREKPNPVPGFFGFHEIWHLFVLGGAILHYASFWIGIIGAGF